MSRTFSYERQSLPPSLITIFIYTASQQGFYFCFSFKRDYFVFGKNNETTFLTFFSVKKEAKKHPP